MSTKFDLRQSELRSALSMSGSAALETADSIMAKIDSTIAKLYEDRNILLVGGGNITNTAGTSVSFTSNFSVYINSNLAGVAPYVLTISTSTSPWAFTTDGNMVYAIFNRVGSTLNLYTDQTTLPAVDSASKEVFMIAKRVGTNIVFRDGSTIPSGRTLTLGTTGDIFGSLGATTNAVVKTNGTDGKTIQSSGVLIDSSNNVTGAASMYFGASSKSASALLQTDSVTQGFLPPRMTTAQKNAIVSPAIGLLVYDTTLSRYEYWNGSIWFQVGGGSIGSNMAIYDYTGGTQNFNVPSGVYSVVVQAVGGGGGGASGAIGYGGGGGGGAPVINEIIQVTPLTTLTVFVGGGGAGSSGGAGGNGGHSYISVPAGPTYYYYGGVGGGQPAGGSYWWPYAVGVCFGGNGGTWNVAGPNGWLGDSYAGYASQRYNGGLGSNIGLNGTTIGGGGGGGASLWGIGGNGGLYDGYATHPNGSNGAGFGSGGGGACSINAAFYTGGNGTNGRVLIFY